MSRPEPVFSEPWHAQVFALTVHLNETGAFAWPEWAAAFGDTLKEHGLRKDLDGGDDYFMAWLETLEGLLSRQDVVKGTELLKTKIDWEAAYRDTPHGQPVTLKT